MSRIRPAAACMMLEVFAVSPCRGQKPPAPRPLGPVVARSVETLGAVSQVRALSDGRVLVNDNARRRVLLFDAALKTFTVVADATSATANAYSSRMGGLIRFHGDSTLFADPNTLSMLVIDPSGKITRTMAVPEPDYVQSLIGGPFGTPGLDARGRLVHRALPARQSRDAAFTASPDSAVLTRVDLATRSVDTAGKFMIPKITLHEKPASNGWTEYVALVNPLPLTDDWAMLEDGTVAIVRGREYRVDFVDEDDHVTSGPRVPFDWERVPEDARAGIVDSTRAEMEKLQAAQAARNAAAAAAAGPALAGPRTGANGRQLTQADGSTRSAPPAGPIQMPLEFVPLNELPDYRPAFRQGAVLSDRAGLLWIRTSKFVNGGAVYDVIDKKSALVDRVQVPAGRVIAGFGPGGVVYMGVVDGDGTRLEKAKVR